MTKPDPTLLIDVVAPKVLEALGLASEALSAVNVRHVVVGRLAVGAMGILGRPRALTSSSATLGAAPGSMMAAAPLVYMKLKSPRRKDQGDVIEMIKGGIDTKSCREYLAAHVVAFATAFDECVAQADAEQD